VLLYAAALIGVAAGLLTGGSLSNLQAMLRLRWIWVLIIALLVRVATTVTPLRAVDGMQYVYVASQVLLAAWAIGNAGRLWGLGLAAAGTLLNVAVMLANEGRMTVAPSSGEVVGGGIVTYKEMTDSTRLNWLGDWIGVAAGRHLPFSGAYSPGDFVITLGLLVLGFQVTRLRAQPAETRGRIVG
jgi:hypothetical protein